MTDTKDQPNTRGHAQDSMLPAIEKCRNVSAGSDVIMNAGTKYLPQHPKESADNYNIRLRRPTFVNFFGRTLDGLTGMVFRRDPQLAEDVPAQIAEWWENIDNRGTHGDVFLKNVFRDAAEAGHAVIFVDMPRNPAKNLAEELRLGIRPYFIHYRAEDVYSTRSTYENGQLVLQQIVFKVVTHEPDGKFGDKEVVRYKQYQLAWSAEISANVVLYTIWEKNEKSEWFAADSGTITNVTQIPVVFVYGKQTGPFTSVPPLLDLANLSLLYYLTNSDLYHAMHIADVPVPVITGAGDESKVVISPNSSLLLPEGATASYLETSGAALGHTTQALKELKSDIAMLGLSMLSPDKRAAETAEAKRIDKADSDSALAAIARSLGDAVEQALKFMADFMRLPSGGSVEINKDYEDVTLTPDQIRVYAELVASGDLSQETLWQLLIQGEVLPADFDPEVELSRLEEAIAKEPPPIIVAPPVAPEEDDEGAE